MAKIGENRRFFFFEKASISDKCKTIPHEVRCVKLKITEETVSLQEKMLSTKENGREHCITYSA